MPCFRPEPSGMDSVTTVDAASSVFLEPAHLDNLACSDGNQASKPPSEGPHLAYFTTGRSWEGVSGHHRAGFPIDLMDKWRHHPTGSTKRGRRRLGLRCNRHGVILQPTRRHFTMEGITGLAIWPNSSSWRGYQGGGSGHEKNLETMIRWRNGKGICGGQRECPGRDPWRNSVMATVVAS